ncbi:MAG: hypothetical protein J6Y36_01215 [Treponema sp.]|nr:hypothetical protein [Treponema sp.]
MDSTLYESLMAFGLSRQEAVIYVELIKLGDSTGYEISKVTGISRSNVYSSLSELVNKGACYVKQEEALKYTAVQPEGFLDNTIEDLKKKKTEILKKIPSRIESSEGYITIKGFRNIRNKIFTMLEKVEKRLYVMASGNILKEYDEKLKLLVNEKKKVVIISDTYELKGAVIYKTQVNENQIRFITDSAYVLTGGISGTDEDNCLYSGQSHLVDIMKESLKNKITLIEQKGV